MELPEKSEAPDAAVNARMAEARLGVRLGELAGQYHMAVMQAARLDRPALHAALCQQRDQLEALIARLQPALLFEDEPAVG